MSGYMLVLLLVLFSAAAVVHCCSEGVYREKRCSLKPAELNHAVILVGWGTDKQTKEPYWIVKNSEWLEKPTRV